MRLLGLLVISALSASLATPVWATNYVVIGPNMEGEVTSLDFDSIKAKGNLVIYDTKYISTHDPRFHVPEGQNFSTITTVGNCDDKTSAMSVYATYDVDRKLLSRREMPEKRLQFAHYADSMDRLLLAVACARVATVAKALSTASASTSPPASLESAKPEERAGVRTYRFPDGSEVSDDRTGKGAVMCNWGLDVALLAIGRKCPFDEDEPFDEELKASIKRINHFIVANSHRRPVTWSKIEATTSELLEKYQASPEICHSDFVPMYGYLRKQGAAALQTSTTNLLSIPREPVTNPCF